MTADIAWAFGNLPERPPVRRTLLVGAATVVLGLGGFLIWAATAPLSSAALAPGIVKVDGNRKTVQHLEGGIIAELLVREGQRVAFGQPLLRLDNLEARALHQTLDGQTVALQAQEARLLAERDGLADLLFPAELEARRGEPRVAETLEGQARIFESRKAILDGQIGVVDQRIAQLRAQIAALEAQLVAGAEQLAFIREEIAGVNELVAKGLERRPRLLALRRTAAHIAGQQGDLQGRIAQAREGIAEAELQIINLRKARVEEASMELREVQTRRLELVERLPAAAAAVGRREVTAPQAGVVLNLRHHTVGGVVAPGQPILDLVPEHEPLIIEARVSPGDIDQVRAGLSAKVVLPAFKQRTTPQLEGGVVRVSADVLSDERTGRTYYTAQVAVEPRELERLPGITLQPGMPAEVIIESEARTLLDYLIQPITDSFRHAFREP